MFQWAWSYLTYERAARLITGESRVVSVPSMEYAEQARKTGSEMIADAIEAGRSASGQALGFQLSLSVPACRCR